MYKLFYHKTLGLTLLSTTLAATLPAQQTPTSQKEESVKAIQQFYTQSMDEPEALIFTPPEGWMVLDPKVLSPRVKVMVLGKSQKDYPPSINLGIEPFKGTTKDYLKIVKSINESQGSEWKDLGMIKTQAGDASLSQVDMPTEWGPVRLMHVILIRNGTLYILTAAALKEEFPQFYRQFFNSMTSLRFNKAAIEMVSSAKKRSQLQKALKDVQAGWKKALAEQHTTQNSSTSDLKKQTFESPDFQKNVWIPFNEMLGSDFSDMGSVWKNQLLTKTESELFADQGMDKKITTKQTDNQKLKK